MESTRSSVVSGRSKTIKYPADPTFEKCFISIRDPDFAPSTHHRKMNGQFTNNAANEAVRAGTARMFCDR